MRGDGVGVVAPAAQQDGRAVGVALGPAREVDRLLQHRRRLVRPAHAELCQAKENPYACVVRGREDRGGTVFYWEHDPRGNGTTIVS